MQGMPNEGRRLYVDNRYTSLPVCKYLLERNTRMCGTVRRNRKGLPGAVIRAKQQKGAFVHRRRGSIMVLKHRQQCNATTYMLLAAFCCKNVAITIFTLGSL